MARKDVELVIRAKNEASKAVNSVEDALKALTSTQAEVVKGASKTETGLSKLGTALGELSRAFKGATVGTKLASEMDRASSAMQRLEGEVQGVVEEQKKLAKSSEDAAAASKKLQADLASAASTLEAQKTAVKSAKASQEELNAALREATAERDKLARADENTVGRIERQKKAIDEIRDRYEKLAQELIATERPTNSLKDRFEASVVSLEKAEAKLRELSSALETNRAALTRSTAGVQDYQAKAEGTAAALEQQKAALTESVGAFRNLDAATKAAVSNQGQIETAAAEVATALAREQAALDQAKQDFIGLSEAAGQATAAQSRLALAVRGELLKAFGQQREEMLAANAEYLRTQAVVKALANELKTAKKPSDDLIAAFNRAVIAAQAAKAAYGENQVAVQQMRTALRTAGTDFDSLVQAQTRFAQVQTQTGRAIGEIKDKSQELDETQKRLAGSAEQAGRGLQAVAGGARSASDALDEGGRGTSRFAAAMKELYGDTRQTLSFTQRLRGEVLSLVASFAGFYAAVEGIKAVVKAYTTLQAANNRLQVVFDGNKNQTAIEMDFLRRTANRLGVEFGTLAGEYSKFAIATKDTNLEGERTRKIFTAVAEAAVVNGSSLEETKGVYLALTQIVSKGSVQMEELRQQLGDRLPGALQLMADGVGVTTAELIKLIEAGNVSSSALVGFADALNKKFGGQLNDALQSVNGQISAFQNNLYNALLIIGQSQAIEKFAALLKVVNAEFKSAEGESFFRKLGVAIGFVFDILKSFVENIRLVGIALTALAAVKIAPLFIALGVAAVTAFTGTTASAGRSVAAINLFRAATGAAAVQSTVLTSALLGIRAAFLALLGSTGIGLLVAAVGAGIGYWITRTSDSDAAMHKFRSTLDEVKDAYERANGSAEKLRETTKGISRTGLAVQKDALKKVLDEQISALNTPGTATRGGKVGGNRQLDLVVAQFKDAKISAEDAIRAIDKIAEADPKLDKTVIKQLQDSIKNAAETKDALAKVDAQLRVVNGTVTEADKVLLGLSGSTKNVNDDLGAGAALLKKYNDAILVLKESVPALAAEMKQLKAFAEINSAGLEAFGAAIKSGDINKIRESLNLYNQAGAAINEQFVADAIKDVAGASKITADTLRIIKQREGLELEAYRDKGGVPTIGLGNTTYADGRKVQMGDKISEAEAYTLAVKALADISGNLDARIQVPITNAMRDALVSYAYNVGVNSPGLAKTIAKLNERDYAGAQDSIKNGINTVKGVPFEPLTKRRADEARDFGREGLTGFEITKSQVAEEQKRAEKAKEFREGLKEELETKKFTLEQDKKGGVQAEINKAIREKEIEAKKAGVELSKEERDLIIANTTEAYNQQHAEDAGKEKKKEALAAEKEINAEVLLRTQLQKQLTLQLNQGDLSGAEATRASLEAINKQLSDNIPKAIAMWEAIGGADATAAITKLKATQTSLQGAGEQIVVNWKQVDQTFASTATNGITSAVESLAQAAAGTKSWAQGLAGVGLAFAKFAADFLQQIAQMIIKQAILNALQSATGGSAGSSGGFFGTVANAIGALVKHDGGLALAGAGRTRTVSPAWFDNAVRYHGGGIAGLKPNEVPTILEKNEEILTAEDPRHMFNNKGGSGEGIRNILAFNDEDIANALASSSGEKVMLTYLKRNAPTLRKLFR